MPFGFFGRKPAAPQPNVTPNTAKILKNALTNYNKALKSLNRTATTYSQSFNNKLTNDVKSKIINGIKKYARSVYQVPNAKTPSAAANALKRAATNATNLKKILQEVFAGVSNGNNARVNAYKTKRNMYNQNLQAAGKAGNGGTNNVTYVKEFLAKVATRRPPPTPPPPQPPPPDVNKAIKNATNGLNTLTNAQAVNRRIATLNQVVANAGDRVSNNKAGEVRDVYLRLLRKKLALSPSNGPVNTKLKDDGERAIFIAGNGSGQLYSRSKTEPDIYYKLTKNTNINYSFSGTRYRLQNASQRFSYSAQNRKFILKPPTA